MSVSIVTERRRSRMRRAIEAGRRCTSTRSRRRRARRAARSRSALAQRARDAVATQRLRARRDSRGVPTATTFASTTCVNRILVLRQLVGDREPRRLGPDEDVRRRPGRRIVDERPQRHVDERAVAHDRLRKRATGDPMGVAGVGVTVEHEPLLAFGDPHSSRRMPARVTSPPPRRPT